MDLTYFHQQQNFKYQTLILPENKEYLYCRILFFFRLFTAINTFSKL
jgi:hypothetical protein